MHYSGLLSILSPFWFTIREYGRWLNFEKFLYKCNVRKKGIDRWTAVPFLMMWGYGILICSDKLEQVPDGLLLNIIWIIPSSKPALFSLEHRGVIGMYILKMTPWSLVLRILPSLFMDLEKTVKLALRSLTQFKISTDIMQTRYSLLIWEPVPWTRLVNKNSEIGLESYARE